MTSICLANTVLNDEILIIILEPGIRLVYPLCQLVIIYIYKYIGLYTSAITQKNEKIRMPGKVGTKLVIHKILTTQTTYCLKKKKKQLFGELPSCPIFKSRGRVLSALDRTACSWFEWRLCPA